MRLAPLLLLSLLAFILQGAQAFSFPYFGSKGSTSTAAGASSAQYARYLAHRPLPGTDAFAKVRASKGARCKGVGRHYWNVLPGGG